MHNTDISTLITTINRLRDEKGCPWDRKQTTRSLAKYVKAETKELIEAIENQDAENTCEELGDVFYLILMLSSIGEDAGKFTFADVVQGINEKLIRRHPHVFAGTPWESEEDLARQWEEIKAMEKSAKQKNKV
ncbi:nucleotide pyrophosphohydrolase [Desulforhopalus vacuolatus]|uniref:MazG nucleotide pyrophosphohydrolase domain-containing protein n=1 Tax=Desulforhopalus vacuolatus TaxID=40414 RepID=UPI0019663330|nr:MazG nucleotide pyrophosphohydrolase domain-containing protein [Desulforhopalus vacuolatus]MBM9519037.1 nucleotide pyrophosphohydrolase [Desulforhopalus vacuolatus]